MKVRIIFLLFLIQCFFNSCLNYRPVKDEDKNANPINIKIRGDINNSLQIDSIFRDIKTIPLETKSACLVSYINKVMFYEDKIFILDDKQKLLVFNINGKFLYQIGKIGRGPGENTQQKDFDIDKNGNIYLLDYQRIQKYNINGAFLKSYPFHFSKNNEIICVPYQLAIKNDSNFCIWGGSLGKDFFPDRDFFAMYEMSKEGKITHKYFPVKYNISGNSNIFNRYRDLTLIDPIFGSNLIYSISSDSIKIRYQIDFGEKALDIPVPEGFSSSVPGGFSSLVEFKTRIDKNFYHSINGFIETDEWIYFMFIYKMHVYNVYFSKNLINHFYHANGL
jgi:hypothetical protein